MKVYSKIASRRSLRRAGGIIKTDPTHGMAEGIYDSAELYMKARKKVTKKAGNR